MDWAPRIAPQKIRKLYADERSGVLDSEWLHEVGYALPARCKDIF